MMVERKGSVIEIKGSADALGKITPFRTIASSMVRKVVESGRWFSFGNVIDEKQVNIITITNNKGRKLGDLLPDELFSLNGYRTKLYKYMLLDYMCYCEIPSEHRTADGMWKASFNKMIITSNMEVVADWLGISLEDATAKYGAYVREVDDGEPLFPYLKLTSKNGEHKVTKPRTNIDLEQRGIRVIPMFALMEGVNVLYEKLKSGSFDVTFVKDSGQVRVLNTTFCKEKVDQLYAGNESFVNSNWDLVYSGDFIGNSSLDRGYIRVFELGSSIYNNPTRSINFARIIGFSEAEPDMSFMYIDVDHVLETFNQCLYSRDWSEAEITELLEFLENFEVGTSRDLNGAKITSVAQLENWANLQNVQLSTVFVRRLALCMVACPWLFNGYTGTPDVLNDMKEATENSGSAPAELDWGF